MSKPELICWSCEVGMTLDQRSEADGNCPHCSVEIDVDECLATALSERDELRRLFVDATEQACKAMAERNELLGLLREVQQCMRYVRTVMTVVADTEPMSPVALRSMRDEINRIQSALSRIEDHPGC